MLSAQSFLPIREIRDDVVVLNDSGLRAVVMTSGINFALMSQDEQNALEYHFQNLVNSLDFPIQILIQSRKVNINNYVAALDDIARMEENELLRVQIVEYMEFVKTLAEYSNIMTKGFYVVIPYSPAESKNIGFGGKFKALFSTASLIKAQEERFEEEKEQLWQRVEHVLSVMGGSQIRLVPLKTDELIELFYNLYNPLLAYKSNAENIAKTISENAR